MKAFALIASSFIGCGLVAGVVMYPFVLWLEPSPAVGGLMGIGFGCIAVICASWLCAGIDL